MAPIVFVRFYPKPNQHDRIESILRAMVAATRSEPGCRRYDLLRAKGEGGGPVFCLIEHYADEAAVQTHRESAHYKEYRANIMDLLERPPEVHMLDALDAKPY